MNIKILVPEDWEIWKEFRLDALKNSPESFGSSYAEESKWSDKDFQTNISKNTLFCLFIDSAIVASAGFYRFTSDPFPYK
jgi:hypothetical protein